MLTSSPVFTKWGIAQTQMLDARPFRYCLIHAAQDRADPRIGQAYWHRVHQSPGVRLCPDHLVFLESFTGAELYSRDRFVAAEEVIPCALPVARSVTPSDPADALLVWSPGQLANSCPARRRVSSRTPSKIAIAPSSNSE